MASKLARRSSAPAVRRPSPLIAKLRDKLAAAHRRARNAGTGSKLMRDVVTCGGAAGLGFAESKGAMPARIGPVDSALVVGGLGAFVVPRFVGGKVGSIVHDATLGVLAVASYRIGSGQPVMGEDGLEGGGWGD